MDGWIGIHRKITDHWIWNDPVKFKWWVDILLMTNFKDGKMLQGNNLIEIKRGSFHTSEVKLAERWGVTRRTVNTFLNLLESDEMVLLKRTRNGTTIKVLNYNDYQTFKDEKCTTNSTVNDTDDDTVHDTADDTQYKKVKKVNKEKNKDSSRFTPPTLEEVNSYCKERNNNIDPGRFIDYYEANGWMRGKTKIKDWKACVRTWERNSSPAPNQAPVKKSIVDEVE